MIDFAKTFLMEDPRRFRATGRTVAVGAFGKHPAWDDHVKDLALESESLALAEVLLSWECIRGQIDSAAWTKLLPEERIGFRHLFVWQRAAQILIGRLWPSSDGKTRDLYPMVVCFHLMGFSLGEALRCAIPRLESMEAEIRGVSTQPEVREILARHRNDLQMLAAETLPQEEYMELPVMTRERLVNASDPRSVEGLLRTIHQMESQMEQWKRYKPKSHANPVLERAQQLRVPRISNDLAEAVLFWTKFCYAQIDSYIPFLIMVPLDYHWLDITIGKPSSADLFSLCASPSVVPMVSEIPYTLDEDFRARASGFLEAFQHGDSDTLVLAKPGAATSARGGWRKWLGMKLILI